MSTQVSERPTGEQPRLLPETNPYPENTALVRPYAEAPVAVDVPSAAAVVPVPSFALRRRPGANLAPQLAGQVPLASREYNLALLARVSDGLRNIPGEGEVLFAGAVADRYGPRHAAPVPAPAGAPAAAPAPSPAEDLARYALAGIVYAAARNAEPPFGLFCADCRASDTDWCDACDRAEEKSAALDRLHDLILAASTYAAAVILVARSAMPPATVHAEGGR